ncbi:MAG: hypothetical protein V2I63_04635 [Pseudomonadales bacterium]|jgi:predicted methyltransferase|nr:hypothetical protein [Pseudomonadales bacterium]
MNRLARLLLPTLLVATASLASAETDERTVEKVKAALADPSRPEADRERDGNRKAVETLSFFGLKDDMTVLELLPGGGWYTRVLAPVLAERGTYYVSIGTGSIERGLLTQPGFDKVKVLPFDAITGRDEDGLRMTTRAFGFGVDDVDLVLTFRNLHNFTESARAEMNQATFDALKPGGHYGVVDHTRRHMQYDYYENWRRMDPVRMIKEIEAVGFEFVDFSDLHYRPDDGLEFEVGRASVTGNTDRFTLLFRKPE